MMMSTQYDIKRERLKRIKHLLVKPMSRYEVADATGYPKPSVRTYLEELHDGGHIHIGDWRRTGNKLIPLFALGQGQDVPKPFIAGREEDDEDVPFKREPVVVKIRRDALVAAFFGEPSAQAA
jgi:hypothetical protein